MKDYYNRKGEPITRDEWSSLHSNPAYQVVLRTNLETKQGNFSVSTVWLGIDHGFGIHDEPPLIFETLVFDQGGDFDDDTLERYSTEVDAVLGHVRAIQHLLLNETDAS